MYIDVVCGRDTVNICSYCLFLGKKLLRSILNLAGSFDEPEEKQNG